MLLHEQADLLEVLRPHVLPQRLAHGMGPGLRDRDENELVQRGNGTGVRVG